MSGLEPPTISFPEYNLAQHIAVLCCYALSSLIALFVLMIEFKKRMNIPNHINEKKLNTTISNKSLHINSMFALCLCPMVSFFGILVKIPVICAWPMYCIGSLCWLSTQQFLTFYQIARLKYCFSSKHSSKYGYSNTMFVALYIYGVLLLFYGGWILFHPKYTIFSSESSTKYGCTHTATVYFEQLTTIYHLSFYFWDWFVLSLYIIKIIQFVKKKTALKTEMNDIVYKKVKFILQKILLLTIIYEIAALIVASVHFFTTSNLMWSVAVSFDVVISSFILFLMVEHNNDYYLKLINFLNSCKLCCCCKSLISEVIDHEKKDNATPTNNSQINMDDTIHETADISTKYELKHISAMQSEPTATKT